MRNLYATGVWDDSLTQDIIAALAASGDEEGRRLLKVAQKIKADGAEIDYSGANGCTPGTEPLGCFLSHSFLQEVFICLHKEAGRSDLLVALARLLTEAGLIPYLGIVSLTKKELLAALKKVARSMGWRVGRRWWLFGDFKVTDWNGWQSAYFPYADCTIHSSIYWVGCEPYRRAALLWQNGIGIAGHSGTADMFQSALVRMFDRGEDALPVGEEYLEILPPNPAPVFDVCSCGHVYSGWDRCPACGEPASAD